MTITATTGNLLKADVDALVNTVNCVGVMGKGIALQFKRTFPENFEEYAAACKVDGVQIGKMFVTETGQLSPRLIINFPTKEHWRGKTKLSFVQDGLVDLKRVICERGVTSLALPPLGCGNGGLDWSAVHPLIVDAFSDMPDIDIRMYPPQAPPRAADMTTRSERPSLTAPLAALVRVIAGYRSGGYALTRLEAQKLSYFLQEAGLRSLKLNFVAGEYGPYAVNLRFPMEKLEGHFTQGWGDGSARAEIELLDGAVDEAGAFLADADGLPDAESNIAAVHQLVEGLDDPYGLELLSTVHWVMTRGSKVTDDEIVEAVGAWNDRKRKLFQREHIVVAAERLRKQGWVTAA